MKEKNIKFHLQGFLWLFSVSPGDDMDVRTEQVNRSSVLVRWNLQSPGSSPDVHLLGCWTKEVRLKPEAGFSKEILSSLLVFCWWLKQTYTGSYCLYKSQMQALRALVCKDVCTDRSNIQAFSAVKYFSFWRNSYYFLKGWTLKILFILCMFN